MSLTKPNTRDTRVIEETIPLDTSKSLRLSICGRSVVDMCSYGRFLTVKRLYFHMIGSKLSGANLTTEL